MQLKKCKGQLTGLLVAVTMTGCAPAVLAEELKIGMAADVTSMDPHFYNASPNKAVSFHIFETLVWLGGDGSVSPGLAQEWTAVSDTEWEFVLRDGVKWHDGTELTAADVVYSLGRLDNIVGAPGGFSSLVSTVTDVEALDDHTVRIVTSAPTPNLPISLTAIAIVPAANQGMEPGNYNSGEAMIGTGPYKFVSFSPGDTIELESNEEWWGGDVPWSDVTFQIITNAAVRSTSLLSGDVDLVEMPAAADLPRLEENPDITVLRSPAMRVAFINPMQEIVAGGEHVLDSAGNAIEPNPMTKFEVRKALSIAINREGIAQRMMQGTGVPTGQMMPEGAFTYIPDYPVPEYDPEAARQLLADAGYPEGFSLSLTAANDRVPFNVEVAQAVAQMWSRIGVKTTVNSVPTSVYSRIAGGQEIPIYLGGWSNSSMEIGTTLMNLLHTHSAEDATGNFNWSRYSNPELDAKVADAVSTMDAGQREAKLIEATRIALDDYAVLPLYHFTNLWAMRDGLTYQVRPDAMTFAWLVEPTG